jgi:hypothetical protein
LMFELLFSKIAFFNLRANSLQFHQLIGAQNFRKFLRHL